MLRLLRPTLITFALAVPTASYALGLGDIHVESALHQPLIAQIELVGAVDEELGRLSASLASDELFQKYNLERAPFIFGTRLTVGRDAQGRPVLNMRSTEKFTEPVVTLLVDLHTPGGELVREYTLFLDPAGLAANTGTVSNSAAAAAAMAARPDAATPDHAGAAPTSAPAHAGSAPAAASAHAGVSPNKLLGQTYKVARRDTLAHIATAAGARSRTEQHRLMIAIYRANPAAFQNNFSRMHTGVTLTLPTADQLAAISVEDTNREYDRQMAEWRASLHHGAASAASRANGSNTSSALAAPAMPANTANRADAGSSAGSAADKSAAASLAAASRDASESLSTDHAALTQRIATLEQSLAAIQQELKRPLPAQPDNPAATPATGSAPSADLAGFSHNAASAAHAAAAQDAAAAAHAAPAPATTSAGDHAASQAAASHAPTVGAAAPAMNNTAAATPATATDEETSEDDVDDAPRVRHHGFELLTAAVGASLLFFACVWIYLRRRNAYAYTVTPRYPVAPAAEVTSTEAESEIIGEEASGSHEFARHSPAALPQATATVGMPAAAVNAAREPTQQPPAQKDAKNASSWFEDSFSTPIADLLNDATVSLGVEDTAKLPFETLEPTAKLPKAADQTSDTEVLIAPELEFAGDTVEQKFSFFNPEATTNTEHVVMDGGSGEPKPFVERRKNPADVLRQAIEREPDRSDLRLKLLELYYTAAAENRRAFLDATRQLSKNDKLATPEDWNRIADMGRIIAPDDELFTSDVDDKRVA